MAEQKRLIIIDSNSIIHRAFHALPPLTTKKGELVNAVYGFLLVFLKVIKEFKPDFIAACFDVHAPTFRHKKFKEYKAKRPPAPKELYSQIPKVKEVLGLFNIPIFEKEGFEADDVIGTISKEFSGKKKGEAIILSGDLDILQLVDDYTKAYLLRRGVKDTILYNEELVKEKYQGLKPDQLVDFRALRGDPSDNIPGVAGIGEKTAIELLKKFGTVENLYKKIGKEGLKDVRPRIKELLIQHREEAFLSRDLAEIKRDVPIGFNLKDCQWGKYNKEKVIQALKDLEFNSLVKRLSENEERVEKEKRELTLW